MIEKIKAINPEIIVSGDMKKPYYQIKYYDTADRLYHIGYGSYEYGNVLGWLEEYFEVIEADEQPVVHGHWVDKCKCSACGEMSYAEAKSDETDPNCYYVLSDYCPNCGAKMDVGR